MGSIGTGSVLFEGEYLDADGNVRDVTGRLVRDKLGNQVRDPDPKKLQPCTPKPAAKGADAAAALRSKLSALENAQQTAARTTTLPDGRIRYYGAETPARTPGPTRGASYVTEHNPSTGQVRSWMESYDQAGNVTRVHPKMINGQPVNLPHYPPTGKELGQ